MNYQYQATCQIPPATLDAIYTNAFGVRPDGWLVEIGANDGWHWSCTWGLAKVGWNALYAEPVPELYAECVKTYADCPKVIVKNCCLGAVNGEVELGMGLYGASSYPEYINSDRKIKAQQYRLDDFLDMHHVPKGFDLLLIDVEGAEEDVLAGFSCAQWQPQLVIIERPKTPNQFTRLGYKNIYQDWINTVYQKNV